MNKIRNACTVCFNRETEKLVKGYQKDGATAKKPVKPAKDEALLAAYKEKENEILFLERRKYEVHYKKGVGFKRCFDDEDH